jgi:hypothetical protein
MARKPCSFSALNNFETCPKKFWHLRVERDVREEEGPALRYGKRVHKALELHVDKNTPLPDELSSLQKHVAAFRSWPYERHCEMELAITEKYTPTDWFAKDVWLRAKLDLVLINEKNSAAMIVDYKTGKMKDDGFLQLSLAAAMLLLHYKWLKVVRIAYLWTEYDGVVTHTELTRKDFMEVWNKLLPRFNAFDEAHQRDNFPARPSGLCKKHCPVKQCPYNGVG